jgi:hypothetical protein
MKMIRKTLIAMTAVVLLATVAQAALEEFHFSRDNNAYTKVDGSETIRWPFEYKALNICCMPVKMSVGMWVEVEKCGDKKIILEQVDCGDIGKGSGDFPCYLDCEKLKVRANFDVKLGTKLTKKDIPGDDVIDSWEAYYNGDSVVPAGDWKEVEVCVKAWKARLWRQAAGDEVEVGTLCITAKPNV